MLLDDGISGASSAQKMGQVYVVGSRLGRYGRELLRLSRVSLETLNHVPSWTVILPALSTGGDGIRQQGKKRAAKTV